MKIRELQTRLTTVATELGFTPGPLDMSHRHPRLPLSYPGGHLFVVVPLSSSDHRAFRNARAYLRRVARDVGLANPPTTTS